MCTPLSGRLKMIIVTAYYCLTKLSWVHAVLAILHSSNELELHTVLRTVSRNLKGAVQRVAHAHYDTLRSYKIWFQTRRYRDPGSRTRARYFLQRKKMRRKLWVRVKSSPLLQGAPAWVQFLVEFQHGPSRPLGNCLDEARSSSTGASSSLLSRCHAKP